MAKYETTYELWYEVRVWAEANGYTFANQGREGTDGTAGAAPTTAKPVTSVSWQDVIVWCNAYSEKGGKVPVYTYGGAVIRSSSNATACDNAVMDKTQSGFRLPTEVEWEFAARGGNPSDTTNWNYTYAGSDTVGDVAWYTSNSGSNTHPVGTKVANSLGLYDMSGNVWEWCWDRYGSVSSSTPVDGPTSGSNRLERGGSWGYDASYAGVSYRISTYPSNAHLSAGFRIVCPPSSYVPAVPEGFVSISGATVTGSGSSGVFVSGRTVTVDSFVMAKYETTYELWYEVRVWAEANGYTFANQGREGTDGTTGATPTTAKNEPVTGVSWRDVMVWCNAYSEKNGKVPVYTYGGAVIRSSSNATADNAVMDKTQSGFRLPTEVEWEFAARGGNPSDTTNWNYTYAGSNTAGDVAWYWDNSGTNTHPVGEKIANSLGLYDMSGNVFEWCWDWYGSVSSSTSTDGATSGSYRLVRGGAWAGDASYAGVSYRYYTSPSSTYSYIGFRVVCPPGS
jgi:formylglycine-generating enzyme required for sulfatase activity